MDQKQKAAQQLATIQAQLVQLFGDFCERAPAPGIAALMQLFAEQRVDLVFTVTASMTGTSLYCGFVPMDGSAPELQTLFTVDAPAPGPIATPQGIH